MSFDNASAEPNPPPPSPSRVVIFLAVTTMTLLIMSLHFITVPQTIKQQGGNKLNQASLTVISKLVLMSTWKPVEQVGSMLHQQQDRILAAYVDRAHEIDDEIKQARAAPIPGQPPSAGQPQAAGSDEPLDTLHRQLRATRESLAVMQVVLGARDDAVRTLQELDRNAGGTAPAQALRDAFDLPVELPNEAPGAGPSATPGRPKGSPTAHASPRSEGSPNAEDSPKTEGSPTEGASPSAAASPKGTIAPGPSKPAAAPPAKARPLSADRFKADTEAIKDLSGGWQHLYVLAALTRHQEGGAVQADELARDLQAEAQHVGIEFITIALIFCLNFGAGVVVLLVWLIKGREWNVRAVPIEFENPGPADAFDPLAGWSMLLAFQLVSLAVGLGIRTILQNSAPVAAVGSVQLVIGVQMIVYAVMLGLIAVAIRGRWASIGLHLQRLPRSIALGICLFWGAFVIILAVGAALSHFTNSSNAQNNPVFHIIDEARGGGLQTIAMMALVAMLGPLFEEILFRGVIYTSMRRMMSARVAIPLNGLVFSAVHGDLNTLVPLAVLGMLLAYAYERTRSIATSSVCHCLWNGQTFLVFITLFS